jgi:cysteine desulfurase
VVKVGVLARDFEFDAGGLMAGGWGMIDLDANASTALLPEVLDAMLPWLRGGHANPSGVHRAAREARRAIDEARERVAGWIGALPEEVVFTGGGTESVNTALHSLDRTAEEGPAVVSSIEHSAVLRWVAAADREVVWAPVDRGGRLDLEVFEGLLERAAFVSVMAANNETGVVQPLREVVALARARGVAVHSDAIQAAGKMPLDVREAGVDLLSISAHKFHGPKGVGALFVRGGLKFDPLFHGGGQEGGRRSGTENVAGIVGMGAAARAMGRESGQRWARLAAMRDAFESELAARVEGLTFNGDPVHRLPNTSHVSFEGCQADGLLILLDQAGVACSAGSACMTGKQQPSHVQLAMGIDEVRAKSSLRISFSMMNESADAVRAAEAVARAVEKLRRVQGAGVGPVVVYSP